MPGFMLFIVIVVVVLLLLKSVHDAQQGKAGGGQPTPQPDPKPRPRARPRRKPKPIDETKLADHVAKLREAVDGGLITTEEAVASIVRFTEGTLSEDAARQLLRHRDAA